MRYFHFVLLALFLTSSVFSEIALISSDGSNAEVIYWGNRTFLFKRCAQGTDQPSPTCEGTFPEDFPGLAEGEFLSYLRTGLQVSTVLPLREQISFFDRQVAAIEEEKRGSPVGVQNALTIRQNQIRQRKTDFETANHDLLDSSKNNLRLYYRLIASFGYESPERPLRRIDEIVTLGDFEIVTPDPHVQLWSFMRNLFSRRTHGRTVRGPLESTTRVDLSIRAMTNSVFDPQCTALVESRWVNPTGDSSLRFVYSCRDQNGITIAGSRKEIDLRSDFLLSRTSNAIVELQRSQFLLVGRRKPARNETATVGWAMRISWDSPQGAIQSALYDFWDDNRNLLPELSTVAGGHGQPAVITAFDKGAAWLIELSPAGDSITRQRKILTTIIEHYENYRMLAFPLPNREVLVGLMAYRSDETSESADTRAKIFKLNADWNIREAATYAFPGLTGVWLDGGTALSGGRFALIGRSAQSLAWELGHTSVVTRQPRMWVQVFDPALKPLWFYETVAVEKGFFDESLSRSFIQVAYNPFSREIGLLSNWNENDGFMLFTEQGQMRWMRGIEQPPREAIWGTGGITQDTGSAWLGRIDAIAGTSHFLVGTNENKILQRRDYGNSTIDYSRRMLTFIPQ